jgi:hypothetical protein
MCHPEDLHHFVPKVVDYFNCDPTGLGYIEWARSVTVESGPSFSVDFGFERGF